MKQHQIKTSIGMFNLLKGFAMIIVVYAHTVTLFPDSFFYKCFYLPDKLTLKEMNLVTHLLFTVYALFISGIMPALFLVSGYGFRKVQSNKKNIVKQANSLLKPYIITALITSVVHLISHFLLYRYFPGSLRETAKILAGSVLGLSKTSEFFGITFFSCGPNWFLLALFWGLVIFNFLSLHYDDKQLLIASVIVASIGWVISMTPVNAILCFSQGCISVLFICVGYLAKRTKLFTKKIEKRNAFAIVLFVIIPNLVMGFNGLIEGMADNVYPLGPITIIENGLLSLGIVYLFLYCNEIIGSISSALRTLGRVSLYFLCIHTIEMMGFPLYYYANKWDRNATVGAIVFVILRVIVDSILCFAFIKYKEKYLDER